MPYQGAGRASVRVLVEWPDNRGVFEKMAEAILQAGHVTRLDFMLEALHPTPGRIEGFDGTEKCSVFVFDEGTTIPEGFPSSGLETFMVQSKAHANVKEDGTFQFDGLEPGSYMLLFMAPPHQDSNIPKEAFYEHIRMVSSKITVPVTGDVVIEMP